MLKDKIRERANHYFADVVAMRRHLHAHPELSYEEVETGKYVAQKLAEIGISHVHGVADNGVVGLIEGRNPSKKVVALRADLDALPILARPMWGRRWLITSDSIAPPRRAQSL